MRIEMLDQLEINEQIIARMNKEAENSKVEGAKNLEAAKKNLKICQMNVKLCQRQYHYVITMIIITFINVAIRLAGH